MKGLQHSPGPWHLGRPSFGQFHIYSNSTAGGVFCKSGRQAICTAPYEGKRGSRAYHAMFIANARLIAAAPELLEALTALTGIDEGDIPDLVRARVVIAKATGSTP